MGRVNTSMIAALGRPSIQATCAWVLAELPGSVGLLRPVKPPASQAFIAFVQALHCADPQSPTRCAGWTVHELTAHLAAGSAEIADLIEDSLAGAPIRPTRDFEEREAPYRVLPPKELRRAFFRQALRATVAVDRLSQAGPTSRVAFTGALLDAATLVLHSESELIIHRWDIVGNDDTSIHALSDSRLAVHAATAVAAMKPNVFPPRAGEHETIILRSPGAADVTVTGGPVTTIELAAHDTTPPVVQCHPAVRTLLLWGRYPQPGLPEPVGEPQAVAAVIAMLRPHPAR